MAMLIKLICYLIRLIPVRLLGAIGAGLGRVAYFLNARHRQIAMRNLNRVYPDKSDTWKRRISRESFAELGRTSFELPHVYLGSKDFLLSRLEVDNHDVLLKAKEQGKGVIVVAAHHSNWELAGMVFSMLGDDADIIYRPIRQPALDQFILQARKRFGTIMHARDSGLRWMPKALKNNHCIAIVIDQHLSTGTPVPFLGHDAQTSTLPAIFANKYHTPVVRIVLDRMGRDFKFRLSFQSIPIDENITDDVQTMRMISDSFAPVIHRRPELWLWIHRRWLYLDEREQNRRDELARNKRKTV